MKLGNNLTLRETLKNILHSLLTARSLQHQSNFVKTLLFKKKKDQAVESPHVFKADLRAV